MMLEEVPAKVRQEMRQSGWFAAANDDASGV